MDNNKSNYSIYDTALRLLILLAVIAACVLFISPFISVMLWTVILALAFLPLHENLTGKLGGKPKLASFIIVASVLIVFIVPAWFLVSSLIDEVKQLKVLYESNSLQIPPPSESVKGWPIIGEKLFDVWSGASANLEQFILKNKDHFIEFGSIIYKGIVSAVGGVIQILTALVLAGVLLVNTGLENAIRKFFKKVADENGDTFTDIVIKTIRSVVKGVFGESLIVAMLYGIVFYFAGLPYTGIWTLLVFILCVLQMPLIIASLPVTIYFFATKDTLPAILWTVSLFIVGLSNNFLTPIMLGKGAPVPMPVIFIGVLGGFMVSGFIGLFTGAIVISLGYTLFVGWVNSNNAESLQD